MIALLLALASGSTLVLLGAGGSILTLPLLIYGLGLDPHRAAATSLLVVGIVALAGLFARRRAVAPRLGATFGVAGMLGALPGAWLNHHLPAAAVLGGFGVTMLAIGWRMRHGNATGADGAVHAWAALGAGLASGFATGVFGVGGGFLIVPALVLLAGVPMASAVGTSLAVITLNSFTGFAKYLRVLGAQGLELDWPVLLAVAAVGIVGSFAGHRLGRRLPQATLRKAFGVLLVVMGIFIAVDAGPRLLD